MNILGNFIYFLIIMILSSLAIFGTANSLKIKLNRQSIIIFLMSMVFAFVVFLLYT
jgi:hypothetical protein